MCLRHFHAAGNGAVSSSIFQFFEIGFVILALNSAREHSFLLCRTFYHVVDVLTLPTPRESFPTGPWERSVPVGLPGPRTVRGAYIPTCLSDLPLESSPYTRSALRRISSGANSLLRRPLWACYSFEGREAACLLSLVALRVFSLLLWGSCTFL